MLGPVSLMAEVFTLTDYAEFELATNQTAEVLSVMKSSVGFTKPGHTNAGYNIAYDEGSYPRTGIIAGPATILVAASPNAMPPGEVNGAPGTGPFYRSATIRIGSQAFPPEKTAIVPHLSNGANVALQVSSNLVDWVSTTNGAYSGTNGALFFRINLERAP